MVKHKKLTGFLIIFFLFFILFMTFLDKIVQTAANKFLQPYNDTISAKVSSLDFDFSEASATLQFSARNTDTKNQILYVDYIKLDYDFGDGLKIFVRDVDANLSEQTLAAFQDKKEKKSTSQDGEAGLPPLGFLSSVIIEDISVHHLDAKMKVTLDSTNFDFDQGNGEITNLNARYLPSDLTFFSLPKVDLSFSENLFSEDSPSIDAIIMSPHVTLNSGLIAGLQAIVPQQKEAQEEKIDEEPNSPSSTSQLSLIGTVQVKDFEVEIIDPTQLNAHIDLMKLNMKKGKATVSIVSTSIDQTQILGIDTIDMDFNPKGLTGQKDMNLDVNVQGTSINLQANTADKLKGLKALVPTDPNKKTEKQKPNFLSKLSSFDVTDTNITLQKQGISTQIENLEANISQGNASIENVKAFLAGTKKKILDVQKVTVNFDPKEIGGAEKPSINIIISDLHARLSKEIMNKLKSKEKPTNEPLNLPVKIDRILVSSSSVSFLDYPGIGKQKHLMIQEIFGNAYDISAEPGTPLSSFTFNATFEGESKLIAEGSLDLADQPMQWSVDYRLFGLEMRKLNDELRARIPLTFKEGKFNFSGEAIQRDDKIVGYFKPILDDASYKGNKDEYKGIRHFFAETFATFTNWLFEREETETVATRVPFIFEDGKMNTDVSKAVWNTIEHGLLETDRIEPGVENKYRLKQAQEEKP